MSNQRNTLLKFLIAIVLLATVTSALPTDAGLLEKTGVHLGCTENCNGYGKVLETDSSYNGTGYDYNASSTLSVTTGTGFMAMFFWTLLSLL